MQFTPPLQVIFAMALLHSSEGRHEAVTVDYDKYERPPTVDNTPVKVQASLNLRNIIQVDDRRQIISVEVTLRLYWNDSRVRMVKDESKSGDCLPRDKAHGNLCYVELNREEVDKYWLPDLFVDEAIEVRHPTYKIPAESLYVYEDSTMRFSKRINFDALCVMNFKKYPVDKQNCPIKFESFGNQESEVLFRWLGVPDINQDINLPKFDHKLQTDKHYLTKYYKQHYAGIEMMIHLKRRFNYHLVETYIPSIMYVSIASLSLVVSPEFLSVRAAMGMFTLLTLTNLKNQVKSQVPDVSYLSYMDIWLFVCLVFVFSSIVVTVFIATFNHIEKKVWAKKTYCWTRLIFPAVFTVFFTIYMIVIIVEFNKEHEEEEDH